MGHSVFMANFMSVIINNYDASHIQVLEGLEAVSKRPAMYIDDTSIKGLHHLVSEVVDNCIDEALAGYCHNVQVFILPGNTIRVIDDGRGVPVDNHQNKQRSALEIVMPVLHAGGKFDKNTYKGSVCPHGVGVSCVNALSDLFIAEVRRQDHINRQDYAFGKPTSSTMEIIDFVDDNVPTIVASPKSTVAKSFYYLNLVLPDLAEHGYVIASTGDDAVPIVNDWRDLLYLYSRYCRNIEFFHACSSSGGLPYKVVPKGECVPKCLSQSVYYLLIPKIINASNNCVANNLLAA